MAGLVEGVSSRSTKDGIKNGTSEVDEKTSADHQKEKDPQHETALVRGLFPTLQTDSVASPAGGINHVISTIAVNKGGAVRFATPSAAYIAYHLL